MNYRLDSFELFSTAFPAFPLYPPSRSRTGGGAPTGAGGAGGAVGPGCQLRAQERSQNHGCGLVLERYGPRRPLRVGSHVAGRRGCRGGWCLPPLCPVVAPGDVRSSYQLGDGRRYGAAPAMGGGGLRNWGEPRCTLGGGRRRLPQPGGGGAGVGPAHGGPAAQERGLRFPYTGSTRGGQTVTDSSTVASTATTRRAWPVRLWTTIRSTFTRGLALPVTGSPCPAPRCRPADDGRSTPVQHRPGFGNGTRLSVVRCPFPN